jgi:uncharacterized protein (TIGR02271 family)
LALFHYSLSLIFFLLSFFINKMSTYNDHINNTNMNKNLHTNMNKTTMGSQPATEEEKMVLFEEQLAVGKREVNDGAVKIDKRIETQNVSVPVTLKREEVVVERRPISTTTGLHGIRHNIEKAFNPQTIEVSTSAEQVIAEKVVVPKEEVSVSKTRVDETKEINDTVRKETADISDNRTAPPDMIVKDNIATGRPKGHGDVLGRDGRIVAFEEQLAVGKETVGTGAVGVSKHVESVPVHESVELGHDRVEVTRRPLTGTNLNTDAFDTSSAFTPASTVIPLKFDEALVDKKVVPKEEILLKKQQQLEQKAVKATLRTENIDVNRAYSDTAAAISGNSNLPYSSGSYSSSSAYPSASSASTFSDGSYSSSSSAYPSSASTFSDGSYSTSSSAYPSSTAASSFSDGSYSSSSSAYPSSASSFSDGSYSSSSYPSSASSFSDGSYSSSSAYPSSASTGSYSSSTSSSTKSSSLGTKIHNLLHPGDHRR